MTIGVDFDNTLVCYDELFRRAALERGLIPESVPASKAAVRDFLRRAGREPDWTELQGHVYGPRLAEAEAFPGADAFILSARERGCAVRVISHKTRHPYAGARHDLHAASREWLRGRGWLDAETGALAEADVFFEPTREGKLARIARCGCQVFIDDLPEFLAESAFPDGVRRILFDPQDSAPDDPRWTRARSWDEVGRIVFGDGGEGGEIGLPDWNGLEALRDEGGLTGEPRRLSGGGNNRVFEARTKGGGRVLLKQYFPGSSGGRDRFASERLFYAYAITAVPGGIPRPLGWDSTARIGIFEFIEGERPAAGEVGGAEVGAALDFLAALNSRRDSAEAAALPLAAEACFSLREHADTVERRIARLRGAPAEGAVDLEARAFIADELAPAWRELAHALPRGAMDENLAEGERCVSPSDFGFHNSLRRSGKGMVFFDFEYAGWDDPAKAVCDFFCQPALPPPPALFSEFARGVAAALQLSDPGRFLERCRLLLPVHRLKWCCILLNEFLAGERNRRAFARGRLPSPEGKAEQLAAARRMLAARAEPAFLSHG